MANVHRSNKGNDGGRDGAPVSLPISLSNLGLKVVRDGRGDVVFRQGNTISSIATVVNRREMFTIYGMLTGHCAVAGWLRVAYSFLKRVSPGHHVRWIVR